MDSKTTGATLRSLREKSGLSVKEVIKLLKQYDFEISDKTLYSYESGKRAMSGDMLLALCRIYKCNNILETFADIEVDYEIPDEHEWNVIKKYRTLDAHGKEMVDFTLDKEYERSTRKNDTQYIQADNTPLLFVAEPSTDYNVNAAHERTDIDIEEGVDISENDIMDDKDF